MPNAIEIQDISKRFGPAWALEHVDALVPSGQVVGLLGHNGAGKSTLIKLVLGLIEPTSGTVRVLGASTAGAPGRRLRARVGYLPENVAFYGNLSGREVLRYLALLKGAGADQPDEFLERLGLAHAADRRVHTYSKGMRQRLGLAQALLGDPELLLFDEPTAGLDPMATMDFFELVGRLRAQGRTVLISSHVLAELEPHLDRAVILGHGEVLGQGTVAGMREAAGLPTTIAVRFAGAINGFLHEDWLSRLAVGTRVREPQVVELDVRPGDKMAVVRRLMETSSLVDIEVKEPTLARLHATVGTEHTGAAGRQK
ncbi:MAG TPA: ABC transporter ATP-binding protein [Gammaproteobacteria bacterium]|nr:ABC transporter ATP-binding protein [Gammaproteobacteria bacterium]